MDLKIEERMRNSHVQIEFLKELFLRSNNYHKTITAFYQNFQTVLNIIKRSSIEQINTSKTRSIIKIYGRKRKELIKTIHIFIKNNETSITAKEKNMMVKK